MLQRVDWRLLASDAVTLAPLPTLGFGLAVASGLAGIERVYLALVDGIHVWQAGGSEATLLIAREEGERFPDVAVGDDSLPILYSRYALDGTLDCGGGGEIRAHLPSRVTLSAGGLIRCPEAFEVVRSGTRLSLVVTDHSPPNAALPEPSRLLELTEEPDGSWSQSVLMELPPASPSGLRRRLTGIWVVPEPEASLGGCALGALALLAGRRSASAREKERRRSAVTSLAVRATAGPPAERMDASTSGRRPAALAARSSPRRATLRRWPPVMATPSREWAPSR